jgi:hypothetical protein
MIATPDSVGDEAPREVRQRAQYEVAVAQLRARDLAPAGHVAAFLDESVASDDSVSAMRWFC